jgi:Holliday junction resolvase RusA-like endonuclease
MKFTIPGDPHGKERPRKGQYGNMYTPAKTVAYEEKIRTCYLSVRDRPRTPTKGPVLVWVDVYHAVPKKTEESDLEAVLSSYATVKPDGDNVEKSLLDALCGLYYEDDKQVVGMIWRKYFAVEPRVEVRVESI